MMDGVGLMDTGSNRPLLQMNVESIAEVKILTSGYQAEYGRSSGMQGLFDRRANRQAGRQQQAVLLLQPGILAAHRRW